MYVNRQTNRHNYNTPSPSSPGGVKVIIITPFLPVRVRVHEQMYENSMGLGTIQIQWGWGLFKFSGAGDVKIM